jgi:hypothetical protein
MKTKSTTIAIIVLIGLVMLSNPQNKASAEDLPTVEEVLNRYVEVIGGREAIEKLTTRICIGVETTDLTSREQPIYEALHLETYSKIPGNLYMETWSDSEIYRRGYDGKDRWVKDKCGVRHEDYIGKDRMAWLLNPHNALVIDEYFPNLKMKGKARVRGMEVFILESPDSHRPLFFEIKTGLLIGFGHNWEIHDYRKVDGVLFPHKILMSRKGGSTVYEFSEVRHNEKIDDSIFAMPIK